LQKSKQSCAKRQGKGERGKGKPLFLKPLSSFPVTTLFLIHNKVMAENIESKIEKMSDS
jgi:hypothetical protein